MLSEQRRQRNRNNLGSELKEARVREGFTQKALASALDIEHASMISQMELGYMAIPAPLWVPMADALKMNRYLWVLRCVHEYYPDINRSLFGNLSRREVSDFLTALHKGQLDGLLGHQD